MPTPNEIAAQRAAQQRAAAAQARTQNLPPVPPNSRPVQPPVGPAALPGAAQRRDSSMLTPQVLAEMQRAAQRRDDMPPEDAVDPILDGGAQALRDQHEHAPPEHPLLTALKRDLLASSIDPETVELGGYRWRIAALDGSEAKFAARYADLTSASETERRAQWQTVLAAISVRAVAAHDGAWVAPYQLFGLQPTPQEAMQMQNPMEPPRSLRARAVTKLVEFFDNSNAVLGQRLYDIYEEKIDPRAEVSSYLSDPEHPRFRYACPESGCPEQLVRFPMVQPGPDGRDVPLAPFCPVHGIRMSATAKVLGDRDLPLS